MTVQELRDRLDELVANGFGNLTIKTEGCDCDGLPGKVTVEYGFAYLDRSGKYPTEQEND